MAKSAMNGRDKDDLTLRHKFTCSIRDTNLPEEVCIKDGLNRIKVVWVITLSKCTSIVDQHVNRRKLCLNFCKHCVYFVLLGDVCLDDESLDAMFSGCI